jgi:hypothetical protein
MTLKNLDWGTAMAIVAIVVAFLHYVAAAFGVAVALQWHDALHLDGLPVAEQIHLQ